MIPPAVVTEAPTTGDPARSAVRSRLLGYSRSGLIGSTATVKEIVVALGIWLVTWPITTTTPTVGIDTAWIVGLHLAARQGLHYGHDVAFTFGPLGFLGFPQPYLGWTSAAALLFVAAVHFSACLGLLHLARRAIGFPKATFFVMAIAFTFVWIPGWRLFGVLVFIAVASALLRHRHASTGVRFAIVLGGAVAVLAVGKLNIAAVALLIGTIGVVATGRRPIASLTAFVVTAAAGLLVLWLAVGQRLADVPAYIGSAIEISVGYSQSMGAVDPRTDWFSGVSLLITAVVAGLLWRRTEASPRRDRVVILAVAAIAIFAEYKADFTRSGVGVAMYLATLLAIWPLAVPRTRSWVVAGAPVAGMMAAFLAVAAVPLTEVIDPVGRAQSLASQVTTTAFHRREAAASTASQLRGQYALPPQALSLLAGRTVHVEPWESAMAYAYPEFKWSPVPAFQAYAAYTSDLDRLNADRLASPQAPDRILWFTSADMPLTIDGRGLWFDAPQMKVEMLCRYRPLWVDPRWQVLERVPSRCGSPIHVTTVSATSGEPAVVPEGLPPGIVTMRIQGVATDLWSRLQILAYRGAPWTVSDGQANLRIPLGTAGGPNVIGATLDVGYCGRLAVGPAPSTVIIAPEPGSPGAGTPLTIEFDVIPLADQPSPGINCQ